jgi:hypothetical protein
LINIGIGVCVLVGGRIVEVGISADVEVYAGMLAVSVGWIAATLDGANTPVNMRPIALIPMKSPIDSDRYVASARIIRLLIATINFRKGESPVV